MSGVRNFFMAMCVVLIGCGGQVVAPVHFSSGSSGVVNADRAHIDEAVAYLEAHPATEVIVVGFSDASGDEEANLKLSEKRAEFVRTMLVRAGVDEKRTAVRGVGEIETAQGNAAEARQVAFAFHPPGIGEEAAVRKVSKSTEVSAKRPPPASGSSGSSSASGTDSAKAKGDVVSTGISDFDRFFGKVQPIVDSLRRARGGIERANDNIAGLAGTEPGGKSKTAINGLKDRAGGGIAVTMIEGKPKVGVKQGASGEARKIAKALQDLVNALANAVKALAQLPKQAAELVGEAKTLVSRVPQIVKETGMNFGQMKTLLGACKHNVGVIAKIPKEVAAVGKEATKTFSMLGSSFA